MGNESVKVTDWQACYNSGEEVIALSCVVSGAGDDISGVGLLLNNDNGQTVASAYFEFAKSGQVTPALNLPRAGLNVGDTVYAVVSGEAGGEHFFLEEKLTIAEC